MNEVLNYFNTMEKVYISQMQLHRLKKDRNNILKVDVRNYSSDVIKIDEKIVGAIHIPESILLEEVEKLDIAKNTQIVVYCWDNTCSLGYISASKLLNNGYKNVKELLGGIAAWKSRSLPIDGMKT